MRRGQSLDAQAVARDWADVMRRIKAGMLAVVSRIRQRLPHLTVHDVEVIDREIRDALTELANEDDAGEEAPGDASERGRRAADAA